MSLDRAAVDAALRQVIAHADYEARKLLALIKAEALEQAADEIIIPRASSLAAAWLQGRATKLRNGMAS